MKLKFYFRQIWIASSVDGVVKDGAEIPYFYCVPSSQNENERKRSTRKKKVKCRSQGKTNWYISIFIYTHTHICTYAHLLFKPNSAFDIIFGSV